MRHPGCQVVGVDLERPIVDAASAHYGLPNLRFMQWDYFRFGKPEELEPVDTLLCAMGVVHHEPHNEALFDPLAVRRSREYRIQRDHAIGYFGMWRMAAKEGSLLFAVLRVQMFTRFVSWLDAAREAGWVPDLERTWHVDIPHGSDSYALPGFVFRAVPRAMSPSDAKAQLLPEAVLADHWAWFDRRSTPTPSGHLEGGAALTAYRGLVDKGVLGPSGKAGSPETS